MRNLIFVLLILLVWSCKEERGCTNIHSLNYNQDATIDNGDCRFNWDPVIGFWNVFDVCPINGAQNYRIEIIKAEDVTKSNVIITGLYSENSITNALIQGDSIIMREDAIGTGFITPTKITISYNWNSFGDQCESTWFKE